MSEQAGSALGGPPEGEDARGEASGNHSWHIPVYKRFGIST